MAEEKKIDFIDEKVRKKLHQEIEEGFYYHPTQLKKWHRIKLAIESFLKEKENLKSQDSTVYKDLIDLLNKFKWFSFAYLTSAETIELFKKGLKFALEEKTFPLEKNLSLFLIKIPLLVPRDESKTKIRENLLANNEKITDEQITLDDKKVSPTISNWLQLYNRELGAGKIKKIKIAEFLIKNKDIAKLTPEKKERIRRLFALFEELKIPAITIEGLEEEFYVITDRGIELRKRGRTEEIIKPMAPRAQGPKPAPSEAEELKAIEKEVEKIKKETPLPDGGPASPLDVNQVVENIIDKNQLIFEDEIFTKRFKNIAASFLRDVRGEIEIRVVLKRPQKLGGMELDEVMTDKIINALKEEKPKVKVEPVKKPANPELAERLKSPEEIIPAATRIEGPEPTELAIEEKPALPEKEKKQKEIIKPIPQEGPLGTVEKKPEITGPKEITKVAEEITKRMPAPEPTEAKEKAIKIPEGVQKVEVKKVPAKKEKPETETKSPAKRKGLFRRLLTKKKPESRPSLPTVSKSVSPESKPVEKKEEAKISASKPISFEVKVPLAASPKEKPLIIKPEKKPSETKLREELAALPEKPQPKAGPSLTEKTEPISIHRPPPKPTMAKLEEVKVTPRIYGPIDELRTIRLEDWRRWGTAEEAAEKIKDKINLLEEESLIKKAEGIKSWKESEINKLYLAVGTESIDKGISVEEVISLRQKENRPTLTEKEFDEVVGLNQVLRF